MKPNGVGPQHAPTSVSAALATPTVGVDMVHGSGDKASIDATMRGLHMRLAGAPALQAAAAAAVATIVGDTLDGLFFAGPSAARK